MAIDAKTREQLRLVLQWLIANGGNVRTDLEAGGVIATSGAGPREFELRYSVHGNSLEIPNQPRLVKDDE